MRYEFRVLRVWKGKTEATAVLLDNSSTCALHLGTRYRDYNALPGSRFLLFAVPSTYPAGALEALICQPNLPADEAESLLSQLGEAKVIQPPTAPGYLQGMRAVREVISASWLMGTLGVRVRGGAFLGTEAGIWAEAAALVIAIALAVFLAVRRRFKPLIIIAIVVTMCSALGVLVFGYVVCRSNVWFTYLVG
jgi:hypothetical protein